MGNYSRDPREQSQREAERHYVGIGLQQGVPLLDADVNVLGNLQRLAHHDVTRWLAGNGVPRGNDGFHILPLSNGSTGAVLVMSASNAGSSSMAIDVSASTAASALGFSGTNSSASRPAPHAWIISNRNEPFALLDGATLRITVDENAPATVVFHSNQFSTIGAATASEVAGVLSSAGIGISAVATDGGDFLIRGGDGTLRGAGRMFVEGQVVLNEFDMRFNEQPLRDPNLVATWFVPPIAAAPIPSNTQFVIYLDVWDREVDSVEDSHLLDSRIAIETSRRVRREWAVRLATVAAFPGMAASPPAGHAYAALARLSQSAGLYAITGSMLEDLRETSLSLRRDVSFFGSNGVVVVDTDTYRTALTVTVTAARRFIDFLTGSNPSQPYMAAEVLAIDTLSAIAAIAQQGIGLIDAREMDTRGAFAFLDQLRIAEERLSKVWRQSVLPLERPPGTRPYELAFLTMLDAMDAFLTGPAPVSYTSLKTALEQGNLLEAVRAQEQIAGQFGSQALHATGSLLLTYLGPTVLGAVVTRNVPIDLKYRLSGTIEPDDDIDVTRFIDPAWVSTLRNANGTLPFALHVGPGPVNAQFLVTVQPPDVNSATTTLSLRAEARSNPGILGNNSGLKTLSIGVQAPASEEDWGISVGNTNLNLNILTGEYEVAKSPPPPNINFGFVLHNRTATPKVVDLSFTPSPAPAGWAIAAGSSLTGITVPANDPQTGAAGISFVIARPNVTGELLDFVLSMRDSAAGHQLLADLHIKIRTV